MQQFPKLTCQQSPNTTTADRRNAATISFLRRALADAKGERDKALARAAAAEARAATVERQLANLDRGRKRKREGMSNTSIPSFRSY